jgi:hypothetical protein
MRIIHTGGTGIEALGGPNTLDLIVDGLLISGAGDAGDLGGQSGIVSAKITGVTFSDNQSNLDLRAAATGSSVFDISNNTFLRTLGGLCSGPAI